MKLIVGLGNPGRKYESTRHNIGFEVVEQIARKFGTGTAKKDFQGEVADAMFGSERALLLCPHTFMNLSGRSVRAAFDFYKLKLEDVLIICDDMNLPVGKLRFRARGTAGGQKGLADIIQHLGTQEISRLRVGIDRPPQRWSPTDYVIGKFTKDQRSEIDLAVAISADAVAAWVAEGIDHCMNQYNTNQNNANN